MTSDRKDVFGLGSLANPNYADHRAPATEQGFISGIPSPSETNLFSEPPEKVESTADALQRRLDEVEKNIGCQVFGPPSTTPRAPEWGAECDSHDVAPNVSTLQSHDQHLQNVNDHFGDPSMTPDAPSGSCAPSRSDDDTFARPITMSNEGIQHTEEARKRDRLASALGALSIGTDGFLDADRERDRKLMMIEEIEDLVNLFRDDGDDVSHIHIPNPEEPFDTIQGTLKILKRHNDRRRFGTLADECIMLAATSLETICDGNRVMMGFRPDLRGWSNHVRSKLRRMSHDTSQIASSVMNDYNIGPGMRLMLELVPNLIMYARDKSMKNAAIKSAPEAASEAPANADDSEFDSAVDRLRKK